jgi:hypothetical protein
MQENAKSIEIRLQRGQMPGHLLECMMICSFHHLQGPMVEWVFPPPPVGRWSVKSNWEDVPMMAMPDGMHLTSKDSVATVFFAVQLFVPSGHEEDQSLVRETFYGAAIYAQIPSDSLADSSADVTRNFVQKSCCLMSRQPIFGWMVYSFLHFTVRNLCPLRLTSLFRLRNCRRLPLYISSSTIFPIARF